MKHSIGLNEATILEILGQCGESTIGDIAQRTELVRAISEGAIYVALQRMIARGFVSIRKSKAISADGREREIGFYTISGDGMRVVDEYRLAANAFTKLRTALGTT